MSNKFDAVNIHEQIDSKNSHLISLDDLLVDFKDNNSKSNVVDYKATTNNVIALSPEAHVPFRDLKVSTSDIEPIGVVALCKKLNGALSSIGRVCVIGEVSNFKGASSKGAYFCIKGEDELSFKQDKIAVINVSVWTSVWQRFAMRDAVSDGVTVVITGEVRYYEPYGRVSIVADKVELAGEGLLKRRFQELFAKLTAEGLFAIERKKPLPSVYKRVALMTARQGQAVRDVLNSIKSRDPFMEVYLFPCLVQGRDAPASLIHTMQIVNEYPVKFDAVLVVRGGGSFEDLNCFNDERWIRYCATYNKIPMISGVGHEGDHTLTEYLADFGAITPTAAGEFVAHSMSVKIQRFYELEHILQNQIKAIYEKAKTIKNDLTRRMMLCSPKTRLEHEEELLKNYADRLQSILRYNFSTLDNKLKELQGLLSEYSPKAMLAHREDVINGYQVRLQRAMQTLLEQNIQQQTHFLNRLDVVYKAYLDKCDFYSQNLTNLRERLDSNSISALTQAQSKFQSICHLLDAKSPLKVLAQGFTYTQNLETKGQARPDELKIGTKIRTIFAEGVAVESEVTSLPQKLDIFVKE